jgi:hypothetical protein
MFLSLILEQKENKARGKKFAMDSQERLFRRALFTAFARSLFRLIPTPPHIAFGPAIADNVLIRAAAD